MDAFYYAFGDANVVCIGELPSKEDAAAFSLLITVAGGVTLKTTALLSPEEADEVVKKTRLLARPSTGAGPCDCFQSQRQPMPRFLQLAPALVLLTTRSKQIQS
jgi:hypothetical protein